ncbi:MAG: peroxiredoxin [Bacteroidales bacterium]
MKKKISVGDLIPDFILPDQDGNMFDIKSVRGRKKLVIFFYPKDDSPGCTREACHFRDLHDVFVGADAVVIGISGQSPESHSRFASRHKLNYSLLSDNGNKVRSLFGVPTDLFGILPGRVTYITDTTGTVVHIFNSQVQAEKHVDEALKILQDMK